MSRTKLIAAVCGATMLVGLSACDSGGGKDPAPEPPSEETSDARMPIAEAVDVCMDTAIEMLKNDGDDLEESPIPAVRAYVEEDGEYALYLARMSWYREATEEGPTEEDPQGVSGGYQCYPEDKSVSADTSVDIPDGSDDPEVVTWNKNSAEGAWDEKREWLKESDPDDDGEPVVDWEDVVKYDPFVLATESDAPTIPGLN